MIQIHQALFGYSNGHHMLSCSRQLSSYSLRILEPLSDLSGSEMQIGFEEYITGCPLFKDKCYALSKTWYAYEMKRPGCVWTHTLFIDFSDLSFLPMDNTIDDLFTRPSTVDAFSIEEYSKPIYIETVNETNVNSHLSEKQLYELGHILEPLLESNRPIVIDSEESERYNNTIKFLWVRLANIFFGKISFCTGSLSNRTIDKKPFDIQVVPSPLFKNVSRSINNTQEITRINSTEKRPEWLMLFIREFVEQEECGLKNFISSFSEKYLDRQYFKLFAELYLMIKNKDSFDTVSFFNIIFKFCKAEERLYIINKALSLLILKNDKISNFMSLKPSVILQDLSVSEKKDLIMEFDISTKRYLIETLWNTNSSELKEVFAFLICQEINSFGEELISVFASVVEPEKLPELTGPGFKGSNMLIGINSRLALCKDIWLQPRNFQMETLNCLKNSINKSPLDIIKKVNTVIFEFSKEDICEQLYDTFGDISLETFLVWAENIHDITKLSRWSKLCKYNMATCIRELPYIKNIQLLQIVISALDPYASEVLHIDRNIWLNFYRHFCLDNLDATFCNTFAHFMLVIIIKTNEEYPNDVAYFAFRRVHDVLSKNEMDYDQWEKLSKLLPEVMWYNNWDKCKRLRKAAKKMHYNFNFA